MKQLKEICLLKTKEGTMKQLKARPSKTTIRLLTCCIIILCLNVLLTITEPSVSLRRKANNITTDLIPSSCVVNDGRAVVYDKDPIFANDVTATIVLSKVKYDDHKLPDIEIIEPSFYFKTTDPRPSGKNWPALSRAWNETFAVIDDDSVTSHDVDIWGSQGLGDEIIRQAENGGSPIRTLPPGKYATFSGWYVGNFGHFIHDHVSKIAWLKSLVSDDTNFLLPYHELHEKILNTVDEVFVRDRVVWIQYDETVHVSEGGSLTVMIPKSNYPFFGG